MKTKVIIDKEDLTAYHLKWNSIKSDEVDNVYVVEFEIYDINWVSSTRNGDSEYPMYHDLEDWDNSSDYEPSDTIKPKIEGSIKWDGCCNYKYNEEMYLHHCGITGFNREFNQIKNTYILTAEIMGDIADLDMMGLEKK